MLEIFDQAEKTAEVMKEMAEVVVQEKLLLEECLELFNNISTLEVNFSIYRTIAYIIQSYLLFI